jgi:hypothetical protein
MDGRKRKADMGGYLDHVGRLSGCGKTWDLVSWRREEGGQKASGSSIYASLDKCWVEIHL